MYKIIDQIPDGIDEKDIVEENVLYTRSWNENRSLNANWELKLNEQLALEWGNLFYFYNNIYNYYWIINSKNIHYIPGNISKDKEKIIIKDENKNIYIIIYLKYQERKRIMKGTSDIFDNNIKIGELN